TNAMYPCLEISGERLHFFWADSGNSGWGGGGQNSITLYKHFHLGEANTTSDDTPDPEPAPLSGMAPIVTDNSPTGNQVPSNSLIIITFNKSMNQSSVEASITISPSLGVIFSWNSDNTTLTITPSANLSQNTTYTVTLNGSMAKDLANYTLDGNANSTADGTPADDYTWSFTTWLDTDNDGIPNSSDTDDDGDGTSDTEDDFPLDPDEDMDSDDDGIGDNADLDDDNDGTYDVDDDFPLNPDEDTDTDDDGVGNNEDTDDDDDGYLDEWELVMGTNPRDSSHTPRDLDNDGLPNGDLKNTESWMDTDDDGDGVSDEDDYAPLDAEVSDPPVVNDDGADIYTWIFIILAIAIVGGLLLLMRKPATPKVSSETTEETPETTDALPETTDQPPQDPSTE
ncbi:MAG: Ig-like domain-containing protein, partial [Thermoplasmata archaeon]|nr:Ig-like domain-containing protein [Thermoplasmata archaeon]